jgi:Holliday junction DNA helicase RuvB
VNESRPELNDVAPSSLSHIIGQSGVVTQVTVALDAAFADNRKMDHSLLLGPPGVGKSALAKVIACEMATDFQEVLGQSIASPADLNALLLGAKDKSIIHIDEAHELRKDYQTTLYLALDQRKLLLGGGKSIQSLAVADFTLLLSTTDEYCLLQPLRDRMRLLLRFEFYTVADLTQVLKHRSRAIGWAIDEDTLQQIAERARGTPRIALRLLQSCYRVCRSYGESEITHLHLAQACAMEQLDSLGLGPSEQKYLQILSQGPVRLNVIASMLGLPSRTVAEVTEPFLIRVGLVMKDDQGRRQLTAQGHEHLSKSGPLPV